MVHQDTTNPQNQTGMDFKGSRFTVDNSFNGQLYKEEDFDKKFEQNVACPIADSQGSKILSDALFIRYVVYSSSPIV